MVRTAAFTRPEAVSQRQAVIDAAADITRLGRWKETVYLLDFRPVPVGFVLAHPAECTPTAIGYALGETVVPEHTRNVQVFELDESVLVRKPMTEFVQEVGSLTRDVFRLLGDE